MSNFEIIERLCALLDGAQEIIRTQAAILTQHGIESGDGALENERIRILESIEHSI